MKSASFIFDRRLYELLQEPGRATFTTRELRDAYAFGGGLHCCTADVYRKGGCEDYFPHLDG